MRARAISNGDRNANLADAWLRLGHANCDRELLVAGTRLMRSREAQLEAEAVAPHASSTARLNARPGEERAGRLVVAPFVAVLTAMAAGIALDRFVDPWSTRKWVGLALAFLAIPFLLPRRRSIGVWAALAAFVASGGAWHHHRYSDMEADDLAHVMTETGRTAWLRGVVREASGLRASEGFGFPASSAPRVSTRFVLDLTELSDGESWRKVSGRASTTVAGDQRDILPGQSVEAAGQLALLAAPLNPGEFDYRAFARVEGIRLRFSVGEPQSFGRRPGGPDPWLRGVLGRNPFVQPRTALRLDRAIGGTAGGGAHSGPARRY